MSLRRVLAVTLVLALGAALPGPATAGQAPVQGDSGVGDAYFPLDGNGGIDVRHYEIHDRYRFGSRRLTGRTVLTLRATQDLSRFNLDLLLTPRSVTVDGVAAAFDTERRHELRITPATPLVADQVVRVRVKYAGRPGGITWGGEANWLADDREVVTMNEPHMAAWWFPANDHPTDKARFDIHVRVPQQHRVIANGRRVGREVRDDGTAVTHWRAGAPMTTYNAFFAAGAFRVEHGVSRGLPWYAGVSRQLSRDQQRASMRELRRSSSIVRWLEDQLIRYPFSTTGGVVTSLDPGFALENQTRPTYPPLGPGSRSLMVHELAHQWFGDSVSVQRWRDIWLNEGFATFMEVRWTETHGGRSGRRWLESAWSGYPAGSTFWNLRIADPGPDHIFDYAVYLRGAMTLQALRQRIGNRDFWVTLRSWARTRADGNGASPDFETLAETKSGEDLDAFFDHWLRTGQRPAHTAVNGF